MSLEPVSRRLDALTSKWEDDLPTKFLWTIEFQGREPGAGGGVMRSVAQSVAQVLDIHERGRWSFKDDLFDNRTDDQLGFLFAQSVALPNEQLGVGTMPVANSGGYIAGIYADRRADYGAQNKVDITFLEQNKDIVDMFIRPWLVAVSYHGLIEDGLELKCNIQVNLHSRNRHGENHKHDEMGSSNLRKSYLFEDCVPIIVEADQISYSGNTTDRDIERTASFAFSKYKLIDDQSTDGSNIAARSGFIGGRFNGLA